MGWIAKNNTQGQSSHTQTHRHTHTPTPKHTDTHSYTQTHRHTLYVERESNENKFEVWKQVDGYKCETRWRIMCEKVNWKRYVLNVFTHKKSVITQLDLQVVVF